MTAPEKSINCGGLCCEHFTLPLGPDEVASPERMARVEHGAVIADMVIYLGAHPWGWGGEADAFEYHWDGHVHWHEPATTPRHYYRCKHHDQQTGLCTIYDHRPGMCRRFPDRGVCPYMACRSHPLIRRLWLLRPLWLLWRFIKEEWERTGKLCSDPQEWKLVADESETKLAIVA